MLHKPNTCAPGPRYARPCLGAFFSLMLTWQSACTNSPAGPREEVDRQKPRNSDTPAAGGGLPIANPETPKKDPSSSGTPETKENDPKDLIEALKFHKEFTSDPESLKQQLREILAGNKNIEAEEYQTVLIEVLQQTQETEDSPRLLRMLIDRGVAVNVIWHDSTSLAQAASKNSFQVIECLLEKGASMQVANCVLSKETECKESLLDAIEKNKKLTPDQKNRLSDAFYNK